MKTSQGTNFFTDFFNKTEKDGMQNRIMSKLNIKLIADGQCSIIHESTGQEIITNRPKIYGGLGESFSATDLLAAALGACITSSISSFLNRNAISYNLMNVMVHKELSLRPKTLKSLKVNILIKQKLNELQRAKLLKIAKTCIVHKSLSKNIDITIDVEHE